MNYTIFITTFNSRLELFKSIFLKVKKQRPDVEVLVMINGLTNQPFEEEYRKNVLEFVTPYPNTFPMVFPEFVSNARMWNLSCQFARTDKILMIQDDLDIDDNFFDEFEKVLEQHDRCFILNGSFSSQLWDKRTIEEINWFDERYLGLGHEDGTYHIAYRQRFGHLPNVIIPSMYNSVDVTFKDWQWEMIDNTGGIEQSTIKGIKYDRLPGQRLCRFSSRYSEFNNEINDTIRAKQPVYGVPEQIQYPYQKFYWDNKDKL